jgi:hypothetical protein
MATETKTRRSPLPRDCQATKKKKRKKEKKKKSAVSFYKEYPFATYF